MSRRTLTRFLWTAAVVAALGLAARSQAKPPDLPINTDHTATPDVLPDSDCDDAAPLPSGREHEAPKQDYTGPCEIWRNLPADSEWVPMGKIHLPQFTFRMDPAGVVIEELVPMPVVARPDRVPLIAHLPPVQRRQFASVLLFGVHPLLTLVPTDRLVDLPCDHPPCPVVHQSCRVIVLGGGVFHSGLKCEIVPLPKDVHGTIEIGVGFSLNGAPTYRFLVTEYSGCGNVRTDETFQGCVVTFVRALLRDLFTEREPAPSDAEESCPLMCPGGQREAQHDQPPMRCPRFDRSEECGGCRDATYEQMPSVLENLENLAAAQELRAKARRLAEDGFAAAARKCFEQARQLCPGCPGNREDVEPGCEEEETHHSYQSGVSVMVDGLMKACYLSLAIGRYGHAVDLARQAYALDPERVQSDPVVSRLQLLADDHPRHAGVRPVLPAVDPDTVKALDDVLKGVDGEDQDEHIFQKALAKPYREKNDAPAAVGKGE
jgi:hypothetical protein